MRVVEVILPGGWVQATLGARLIMGDKKSKKDKAKGQRQSDAKDAKSAKRKQDKIDKQGSKAT